MPGDHQILIRRHHPHLAGTSRRADSVGVGFVSTRIDFDAEKAEPLADLPAHERRSLADASRENPRVQTTEDRC